MNSIAQAAHWWNKLCVPWKRWISSFTAITNWEMGMGMSVLLAWWTLNKCQSRFVCQFEKGCHDIIITVSKKSRFQYHPSNRNIKNSLNDFITTIFCTPFNLFVGKQNEYSSNQQIKNAHRIYRIFAGPFKHKVMRCKQKPTTTSSPRRKKHVTTTTYPRQDSKSIRRLSEGEVGNPIILWRSKLEAKCMVSFKDFPCL